MCLNGGSLVFLKSAKLLIQFRLKDYFPSYYVINGRMWLVIKDLHTYIKSAALSRKTDIMKGTGQGRILAPFMYKVYINSFLKVSTVSDLSQQIKITFPSFADDISLLALYPSFL